MIWRRWQTAPVAQRVQWLRWGFPLLIVAVVVIYQLGFAAYIQNSFSPSAHFLVEIAFYSIAGPVVTWLTLGRIGRWLGAKESAERAARAQERHLASITDASADAILSLDTAGLIRSWNRGAESIFDYSAEEMIGQPLSRLLDPDLDREQEEARQVRHTDAQGVLRHYETTCLARDGQRAAVDITRTPLHDDTGSVIGTSVILRDITQRKAQEAVVEEERARIARDLHDGLGQNLYFLGLKLDYIRKQIPRNPKEAVSELRALKATVQTNIQDVRRTIFALRPVDLDGLGLVPAVRQYARDFGEQAGLEVMVNVHGDEDTLPGATEPVLFRLVQEGLNNVVKHADAKHAWVELSIGPHRRGQLVIRDDGNGFDATGQPLAGDSKMGLRQMRERVTLAGGRFRVESAPGEGTTLVAEIPLHGSP